MTNSNMHFAVDKNAVTSGIISMQVKSEIAGKHLSLIHI